MCLRLVRGLWVDEEVERYNFSPLSFFLFWKTTTHVVKGDVGE